MRATADKESRFKIAVNIDELSGMLSCGKYTARKIGEEAEARIIIGRRVLYSVDKVQKYLDQISM